MISPSHASKKKSIRTLPLSKRSIASALGVLALLIAILSSFIIAAGRGPQTVDQRVRNIASQLKCPICEGESVADSPSTLAQQMRQIIRQKVQAGESDQEIIQFFANRYGNDIVWSPPWQGLSLLIWLVPILSLVGGILLLFFVVRTWRTHAPHIIISEDRTVEDDELEAYRAQLEQELAADDALFRRYRTEAR